MALPPTSTKGSSDSNPVTTFEIDFPNNVLTHTGVKASVGTTSIAGGGTGQVAANAAFNALSPMTTGGDLIYGGTSGAATRLANGSSGQVLTSNGTTLAPSWQAVAAGFTTQTINSSGAAIPVPTGNQTSIVFTNSTAQTLPTSIFSAAGTDGQIVRLFGPSNTGGSISFDNNNANGGQIINGAVTLTQYQMIEFQYLSTYSRWVETDRNF